MIHELAGIVGVDPSPLTLRELVWMAEARLNHDWAQTSWLVAAAYNAVGGKVDADQINPMRQRKQHAVKVTLRSLKSIFTDAGKRARQEGPCRSPTK